MKKEERYYDELYLGRISRNRGYRGAFTGTMEGVLNNIFDFANTAVEISLGLIGIMAFSCGLMKVMQEAGICDKLAKGIAPVMTKLFPEVPKDHPAMSAMALWIAANMLGIGNAATPFGLKAMRELQTLNPTKSIATNAQCMMLAIGTTSVTLLPVTVPLVCVPRYNQMALRRSSFRLSSRPQFLPLSVSYLL